MSKFYKGILGNKGDGLGPFNLAVYWKRKYRQAGPKEPWYILTNLPDLKLTLEIYSCRLRIDRDWNSGINILNWVQGTLGLAFSGCGGLEVTLPVKQQFSIVKLEAPATLLVS
jgi:hypothetical protein